MNPQQGGIQNESEIEYSNLYGINLMILLVTHAQALPFIYVEKLLKMVSLFILLRLMNSV